jgi:hypothetical protein
MNRRLCGGPRCFGPHLGLFVAGGLFLAVLGASGCGLEACGSLGDFTATPEAQAVIRGRVDDVPESARGVWAGRALLVRALSVDGAVLDETEGKLGEPFQLALGRGLDHFNVRVVAESGAFIAKDIVAEAPAGSTTELPSLGVASTAAAQVIERYAVRERQSLASTPPATLALVRDNARGDASAVAAFRTLVGNVFSALGAGGENPAFDRASAVATSEALEAAGFDDNAYRVALEAAVDASLVPVVCDPSRLNVMFTVDASGQGKDGNGAPQFVRQPPQEGKVFLGITVDPQSPVADGAGVLRPRLTPNDPTTQMFDDATHGDEVAGDGVFTIVLPLPRGIRVLYKYTNGSPNAGFTGSEEWPGNARILQVEDVLTSQASGQPDCLVIRRDSFGDEASNKNFVNLNARLGGGDLDYDDDLGGTSVSVVAADAGLLPQAGLSVLGTRDSAPLTPSGIAEARENGACARCPAPLTVSADDDRPPRLVAASFLGVDETRVVFSEDVDVQSAGDPTNWLLVGPSNRAVLVLQALVQGSAVLLRHERVDPRDVHRVSVREVTDASLQRNPVADGATLFIGPDQTPPTVIELRGGSIVDINPAARPADPSTGEVFVLTFSEELDRIAAENAANYAVTAAGGGALAVRAAFQRGRQVYLVTDPHRRGHRYGVDVGGVFDIAGNVIAAVTVDTRALVLSVVTFKAVVDFAWRSVDGTTRGLPSGKGLYLTGTVLREARGVGGEDLRVAGRTDIAGLDGFHFEPTDELVDGAPVYALSLRLPPGTYAYKLAYGDSALARDPPATLETVSKGLATRNDLGGVAVDPRTMLGRDGRSYATARLSLTGADDPGAGVVFKRETPDDVVVVAESDRMLPAAVVGTWRDVPFGRGADYDDGLVELPLYSLGWVDTAPPRLLAARARDSESVLLSFDEAIVPAGLVSVQIGVESGNLPVVQTFVGQPASTQIVVRTGAMTNDTAYTLAVSGLADAVGNALAGPLTAGFSSPAFFLPFQPLVDEEPPAVSRVRATSPTEIEVVFDERIAAETAVAQAFLVAGDGTLTVTQVRVESGALSVSLTTTTQERAAPYVLRIRGIADVAGNVLEEASVAFSGFGEFEPPTIARVFSLSPTSLVVVWNEAVSLETAENVANWAVTGGNIVQAQAADRASRRAAAFNAAFAPVRSDVTFVQTTPLGAGAHTLSVDGVADLSGNPAVTTADFIAVDVPPTVDVVLRYLVSSSAGVVGVGAGGSSAPPARALSPATLASQREGVFVLGTALSLDGTMPVQGHPFTSALRGFPADGSPLSGVEPELKDDGTQGDDVAGDHVYSLRIANVPVGSTLAWKAFASFTTTFGSQNPDVPGAAFADDARGPSVFGDGQEYPGNDNAIFLVGDDDDDGVVHIDCLFGDEITFKRKTGFGAYFVAVGDARRRP